MRIKTKDSIYVLLGNRISFFRNRAGLSQRELAEQVGISKSYLSKIEAPGVTKSCSLGVLAKIAEILEVELYLFFRESEEGFDV